MDHMEAKGGQALLLAGSAGPVLVLVLEYSVTCQTASNLYRRKHTGRDCSDVLIWRVFFFFSLNGSLLTFFFLFFFFSFFSSLMWRRGLIIQSDKFALCLNEAAAVKICYTDIEKQFFFQTAWMTGSVSGVVRIYSQWASSEEA
ncbi:hypothetical protein HOY80DRAFT_746677 [Tuber brumale]|nr:hypothetical protein HOY80DRAFT_746677 [Tuber brumale]